MSSTPSPATITYDQMMALFLETREQMKETRLAFSKTDLKFQETDRKFQETDRKFQETRQLLEEREKAWKRHQKAMDRKFAEFGDRIGELIQAMVKGGIIRLFQELGYSFATCSRRGLEFHAPELGLHGEIDLFLENGEYALLVEVKTKLSLDDVKDHIRRVEKFRLFADVRNDNRRLIAAVGGGVIQENVREFALKCGLYVLQQSGKNLEVIPPKGEPKVWSMRTGAADRSIVQQ